MLRKKIELQNPFRVERVGWRVVTVALAAALTLVGGVWNTFPAWGEGLTPQQVARLKLATGVVVSPDGGTVAYSLANPRIPGVDEDGPAFSHLWVADVKGTDKPRPFITGQASVSSLSWTPDGKGIAHLARRGGDTKTALYVIPIDGGEARKLFEAETDLSGYAFSADGRQLAFLSKTPTPKQVEDRRNQGFVQEVYEDGLLPTRVGVVTMEPDGIINAKARYLDLDGSASELHWSPVAGDSRLVVALAPTPTVDDDYMARKVTVVDTVANDGKGEVLARLDNPGKLGQVTWSPDGKTLGLISGQDVHDPSEGRLMVAPAEGGPLVDLLPDAPIHVKAFAWNGNDLIAVSDDDLGTRISLIRRSQTGASETVLFSDQAVNVSAFDLVGSTLAFVVDTPAHPPDIYVATLTPDGTLQDQGTGLQGKLRRLTDSNPWLKTVELAEQTAETFTARDGLKLRGVLIKPLGVTENEPSRGRHPLILAVHGGPEARVPNGWVTSYANPGQVAAARGFAVFYPNYRGSTGRGVAFSKLGQGDAAGKEFDDLVDAVDHLVNLGLVDSTKVGITGGSYGGYATAWCSTFYSERFAAGVMFVGISDKVSKVGTTDIPNEEYLVHALKRPWEDWTFMLERSPIFHATKSKTPLLILHGKEDSRVFPGQSMELYRILKTLGQAPVRLIFYPGEGHGNRRSHSRYDYHLRTLAWMEHYLKGPGVTAPPPPMEIEYPPIVAPASGSSQP